MSHEYAALLKAHRDIPVLSTRINNTVTQDSTFPTKEHPSLLTHTGKTVNIPLNSTLSARHIKAYKPQGPALRGQTYISFHKEERAYSKL